MWQQLLGSSDQGAEAQETTQLLGADTPSGLLLTTCDAHLKPRSDRKAELQPQEDTLIFTSLTVFTKVTTIKMFLCGSSWALTLLGSNLLETVRCLDWRGDLVSPLTPPTHPLSSHSTSWASPPTHSNTPATQNLQLS